MVKFLILFYYDFLIYYYNGCMLCKRNEYSFFYLVTDLFD